MWDLIVSVPGHCLSFYLASAYKNRSPITIRLKNDQLKGNFPLLLTKTQINRINKADKTGVDINIETRGPLVLYRSPE